MANLLTDKRIKNKNFFGEADRTIEDSSAGMMKYNICKLFLKFARESGFDFIKETRPICSVAWNADKNRKDKVIPVLDYLQEYCEI